MATRRSRLRHRATGGADRAAPCGVSTHQVILIPGFMGFDALGDLRYFHRVPERLRDAFAARGIEAEVHEVSTIPTASIQRRAAHVLEATVRVADESSGPLHLVGHSTGGLDARLAVAPTANLPTDATQRGLFDRVESLVSVATPHHGSPLASFFAGAMGKPLLHALATVTVVTLDRGKLPLAAAIRLGEVVSKMDDRLGLRETTLDELYRALLSDWDEDRSELIRSFLEHIADDRALVFQLTPDAVGVLDACTGDPEGIRNGSVVVRATPPGLGTIRHLRHDVYAQALHMLFAATWKIVSRSGDSRRSLAREAELAEAIELDPAGGDNDAIVPTRSQLWGGLVHAARGDHLDVVGHYGGDGSADWLPTADAFDDDAFCALWDDVASFCVG